jgi:hypothetical protein
MNYLRLGLKQVDFPFILAHLWKRKPYRDELLHFKGTFAIVDNGTHERGTPLPTDAIAGILEAGPAWVGILPDHIHKPIRTWKETFRAVQSRGLDLKYWGFVIHGRDPAHVQFQHDLAVELGAKVICFPYRSPRWDYLRPEHISFRYEQRYHLMGLAEKDRLERYEQLPGTWSVDSMKIWKVDLTQPGWHGHKVNHEHHNIDLELLKRNVNYLRERFHAGATGRIPSGT